MLARRVGCLLATRARRVARTGLLADSAEDLGGRPALDLEAQDLLPVRDEVTRRPRRLLALGRLAAGADSPIVEELDDVGAEAAEDL